MKKQVICIHWGTKYGPAYINRLYGMVARNITPPFTFTCFCDNPTGIRSEIICHELPPLDFELPVTKKGIWPKSRLWNAQLADLTGPVLFLDLDLVITDNLDAFFEFGDPNDVILAHNPSNPLERLGQTSVYRFPVGKLAPLLEKFRDDPQTIAETYRYEQRFVTRNAPGGVTLWPKTWVRHFRRHSRRMFPLNYFLAPKLEKGAKIVIFPGDLTPQNAIDGIYHSSDTERTSPCQHIRDGLYGRRKTRSKNGRTKQVPLLEHLRHYILPTKWVKDTWKE